MIKNKIMAVLFAAALFTGLFAAPASAAEFGDTAGHWARAGISAAVDKGLFQGTGSGCFSPDVVMTRGMFVTVLGRFAEGLGCEISGGAVFADVADGAFYTPYVRWAADNGIVYGTGNGCFSPNAQVTREQMCALFVRFLKAINYNVPQGSVLSFTDSGSIGNYARESVRSSVALGLIKGIPDEKGMAFLPKKGASRAEGAVMFLRLDALPGIRDLNVEGALEEKREEAAVAERIAYMLKNYDEMSYVKTADQPVRECFKILTDTLRSALRDRENGAFLSSEYVRAEYGADMAQIKALYQGFNKEQKKQFSNVVVRMDSLQNVSQLMEYFGIPLSAMSYLL